jgi:pimeloyl-ACP methyl ester carboxylesterase
MPVVVIRGVPGSGKSWLKGQLSAAGVTTYDTDELLINEFRKFVRTNKFHQLCRRPAPRKLGSDAPPVLLDELSRRAQARVRALTARARRPGGPCVAICGVMFPVKPTSGGLYFIRLAERDLPAVYRRYIIRNLTATQSEIPAAIEATGRVPVDEIAAWIEMTVGIRGGEYPSYEMYKRMYRSALEFEQKQGAHCITQAEILHRVLAISRPATTPHSTRSPRSAKCGARLLLCGMSDPIAAFDRVVRRSGADRVLAGVQPDGDFATELARARAALRELPWPVDIIGHSYGALVALALVSENTPAGAFATVVLIDPTPPAALAAAAADSAAPPAARSAAEFFRTGEQLVARVESLTVPLAVIVNGDPTPRGDSMRRAAEAVYGARRVHAVATGAGHWPHSTKKGAAQVANQIRSLRLAQRIDERGETRN